MKFVKSMKTIEEEDGLLIIISLMRSLQVKIL